MTSRDPAVPHGAAPAEGDGRHVRTGMQLFIVSEAMLFAAFFAAYFYLRGETVHWPPQATFARPELALVSANTLLLLASSVTLQRAHGGGRTWRRWLGATIALGSVFLVIQGLEYSRNAFTVADGVFGSTFYTLTSFHGAHVAIGLLALAAMLQRARRGFLAPDAAAFAAASYYWHFVDVVWLFLFTTVYVL